METANLNIHTDKEIKMANVPNSVTAATIEEGRRWHTIKVPRVIPI